MSLSLGDMITILRRTCGVDENDDGFDDDGCTLKLNRSFWEQAQNMDFRETEIDIPFATTADSRKYGLPQDFNALRGVVIFDLNNQSHRLDQTSRQWYDKIYNSTPPISVPGIPQSGAPSTFSQQDLPRKYFRENEYIVLWPTPDQVYQGNLLYWKNLADLAGLNDILPFQQHWSEIVLMGGIWRGFLELGDTPRYTEHKDLQDSLISRAVPTESKEEIDTHMSHIEVPGRHYP